MKKRLNAFVLAAFFSVLTHYAYAQPPVFGPEFFFGEAGESKRVIKEFSVQDTGKKYILSIQSGENRGKNNKVTISINGKRVALPDELRERLMVTEPATLQKKNEISVEIAGEADAPFLVTIMNTEEHTATAQIPRIGGVVGIEGYAAVLFPSGSFSTSQNVTITVTAEQHFEANVTVPHLPYEIRINSGDHPPAKDVHVSVNVTDSLMDSDYAMYLFVQMHGTPDVPDLHDKLFKINSGVDDILKMVKATLPRHAFSNLYSKNGTYEATFTVGLAR
ncbi:MAG TPA: hypothetical protein VMW07_08380 [Gallionella sp.]|jgi:hypothetical protein|nr:hypothetical protein [Gallionella sp.]